MGTIKNHWNSIYLSLAFRSDWWSIRYSTKRWWP